VNVELVIDGGTVVTMDAGRRILANGAVAIDEGRIVGVGSRPEIGASYRASRRIDARGCLVTPGFIDVHNHPIHFLSKGIADDLEMSKRSYRRVWPFETSLTHEEAYVSSTCTFLEMIANGTTCFCDPGSRYPDAVGAAARDVGIRGIVAREEWDVADHRGGRDYGEASDETLGRAEEVVHRWHGACDGRLRAWFSLVRPAHVTNQLCVETKKRADELGVGVHAHLHVSPTRKENTKQVLGYGSAVSRYAGLGLLGNNLLLAHLGTVERAEIDMLAEARVKVAHCPSASMLGGFGAIALGTFPEMFDAGVTVGLGSDAGAISRFLDMVRVMYLAACAHKDARMDPEIVGAEKAFEMATIEAAAAVLWDDEIGSLEPGKRGDVTVLGTDSLEWRPNGLSNPIANLVYSASGRSTRHVVVDGRVIMEERRFEAIDVDNISSAADAAASAVLERIGVRLRPSWPVIG